MQKVLYRISGLQRHTKMVVQITVDSFIVVLAFVSAVWLRLDSLSVLSNPKTWIVLVPAMPVALVLLYALGFYRAVVRYMAARALQTALLPALLSALALGLTAIAFSLPIVASVSIIYAVLLVFFVGASRYLFREAVHKAENRSKERVVIYGSGEAGRQLAETLLQGSDYLPIAFLDDDKRTHDTFVSGLAVHPPPKIEQLIRNNSVTSILLAIPSASQLRRSEILKWLEQFPLKVRTIPGLHAIISGRARVDEVNEISVNDLLGRAPISPQKGLLSTNISGKSVMVTGAGGSIGSELCRQILQQGPRRLVLFEMSELALYSVDQELSILKAHDDLEVEVLPVLGSVQDRGRIERCMRRFGVQTVYHAAATKHVSLVEGNPAEGVSNNVFGTKAAVEAAVASGVSSFVMVSTDKAVRPTSIMGASKRLAEQVCQSIAAGTPPPATTISMVRFGNVLDSSGSVIPLFRRQIAAGGPITVTDPEITRFFMTIAEAAELTIQAGAMAKGGDIFVLDMGEPVRIAELAAQMARLHGLKPVLHLGRGEAKPGEIGIVFTRPSPGEKLYEELLVGGNPEATSHPRIMKETENQLPTQDLGRLLQGLQTACAANDTEAVRRILVSAEISYQPPSGEGTSLEISDEPDTKDGAQPGPRLTLVH